MCSIGLVALLLSTYTGEHPWKDCLKEKGFVWGYNVDPKRIKFHLFTRKNPEESVQIFVDDSYGLQKTFFDPKRKTKILLHGWRADFKTANLDIRKKLLSRDDFNIIDVDWTYYAKLYLAVADKSAGVGRAIAGLVDYLSKAHGLNPADVHCIGHSWGAHVCGFLGKSLTVGALGRISGTDPSRPGFNLNSPRERLDAGDALFVDCIHTTDSVVAISAPLCSANFYPNGGGQQPGCPQTFVASLSCGHFRSRQLFEESILEGHIFPSSRCKNRIFTPERCKKPHQYMGFTANEKINGIFYTETNSEFPFSKNWTTFQ